MTEATGPAVAAAWQRSVVYQIYPRSFCDSDGDGIGDLRGITSRLDHLTALGVDVVWLSPIYASPGDDNGYDISDYRAILPAFGTMADFDEMLAAMRARGLTLMMDLVVNHTSDEHDWFRRARSSRDDPHHDYYIWREPRDGREPNNWESAFGGSAWQFNEATGEYYLHLFSRKQPDLNWENPRVRAEVWELMRFWLDKGVGGFRMDVINMISKRQAADGSLPDAPVVRDGFLQPAFGSVVNGPRLMDHLREMKREVLDGRDCITVGEAPLATTREGRELTHRETGVVDMLFQFEHMEVDNIPGHRWGKFGHRRYDLVALKSSMARWQHELAGDGWNSLYLCNHDQPRSVSRFGDDGRWRTRSAKLLATWLHGMQGTPYVYQGEELAMANVRFGTIDDYRDIETLNFYREAVHVQGAAEAVVMAAIQAKSRDNARTPMRWNADADAGFTTGTPWIAIDPAQAEFNAECELADPDSVFHHYRRLIALRHEHPVFVGGRYRQLLPDDPQIDAYTRTFGDRVLLVVCHFGDGSPRFAWPSALRGRTATLLIANVDVDEPAAAADFTMQPWEARIYLIGDDARR